MCVIHSTNASVRICRFKTLMHALYTTNMYMYEYMCCDVQYCSLEEAAYLLRELERLPLLGSASSCQPTAARNSSRSSISAQPLARSVLQDVVNGSPLRTMNASPARRQRTAVLMHIAETLRVPYTDVTVLDDSVIL